MLCVRCAVQLKRHHDSTDFFLFAVDHNEVKNFTEMSRNGHGAHGTEVAAPSHRRACAGECAFFCGECGVH